MNGQGWFNLIWVLVGGTLLLGVGLFLVSLLRVLGNPSARRLLAAAILLVLILASGLTILQPPAHHQGQPPDPPSASGSGEPAPETPSAWNKLNGPQTVLVFLAAVGLSGLYFRRRQRAVAFPRLEVGRPEPLTWQIHWLRYLRAFLVVYPERVLPQTFAVGGVMLGVAVLIWRIGDVRQIDLLQVLLAAFGVGRTVEMLLRDRPFVLGTERLYAGAAPGRAWSQFVDYSVYPGTGLIILHEAVQAGVRDSLLVCPDEATMNRALKVIRDRLPPAAAPVRQSLRRRRKRCWRRVRTWVSGGVLSAAGLGAIFGWGSGLLGLFLVTVSLSLYLAIQQRRAGG